MARILVIDDDPGLLSVCSVGLQALGHTVCSAETGQEGISQAAVQAPDVIVLDLGLPDLDGLEVCKRIRTWSEVPVIGALPAGGASTLDIPPCLTCSPAVGKSRILLPHMARQVEHDADPGTAPHR